ncbi:MAG: membrane protein insertase YidC [Chitinophagaceae bacterium]|nr:membrane protein insertase YidC [Anaerolineae bacterium]
MWDLIINPFVTVLTLMYRIFNNDIVLAIAAFTVIIRLLTSPLLIQQQRSAKSMQELQPKLKALQEKHKNDREKLGQEQMALYKEHGINPFGGCLPLLIQLPILLALYSAIQHALGASPYQLIDLSGRLLLPGLDSLVPLSDTWAGMNLTQPPTANPVYAMVLPLLVLVTTWLQSKLTLPAPPPPSADGKLDQSAQMTRSMTTIMPLMFGFFSLQFSVGLGIYFVVSNVVGIAQYTLMGKAEWGRLLGRDPKPKELTSVTPVSTEKRGKRSDPVGFTPEKANGTDTVSNGTVTKSLPSGGSPSKKTKASKKASAK